MGNCMSMLLLRVRAPNLNSLRTPGSNLELNSEFNLTPELSNSEFNSELNSRPTGVRTLGSNWLEHWLGTHCILFFAFSP